MLSRLLNRLLTPDTTPLPDADARLALTALLVRVARADGSYDAEEATRIERIVAARYGLLEHQAQELRTQAEQAEAEAPDTHRFTLAIKEAVPYEDRLGVIIALWEVVLADGARDPSEDALLRLVANLLGVSDRDSALARQTVERGD